MEGTFDTVIISDLHLGSEVSRAKDALRMLRHIRFQRLILLGDIFCDLNFARLKKDHWQFLSYIRKLSNPKRNIEVVWVEGNHDKGLAALMSHLVGVNVLQEYMWSYDGVTHLAVHGHQFDRFVVNNGILSVIGASVYLQLQKLDTERKLFVRFLDRLSTKWLRLSDKVSSGAIEFAKDRGATRVFCGHTHKALHLEKNGVEYFNSGSWTQADATYITIDESGVALHDYAEMAPAKEAGDPANADREFQESELQESELLESDLQDNDPQESEAHKSNSYGGHSGANHFGANHARENHPRENHPRANPREHEEEVAS